MRGGKSNYCEQDSYKKIVTVHRIHSPGLQALLPRVKVHRCQLARRRLRDVKVERLRLADERTAVCGHVNHTALLDLPRRLVQCLELCRHAGAVLDAAAVRDNLVAQRFVPKAALAEVLQEVAVDHRKLAREHTARVHVGGVRFEAPAGERDEHTEQIKMVGGASQVVRRRIRIRIRIILCRKYDVCRHDG